MKEAILKIHSPKHVKIFKLHQAGLTNKEISDTMKTGAGHVYNVLKDYEKNPQKAEAANAIAVEVVN